MAKRKQSRQTIIHDTPQIDGRAIIAQFDRYYEALRALYKALRSESFATDTCIAGYWHQQNDHDLPEWEKEFDRKYSDMMETIIGMARMHGLEPNTYLTEFFEACNESDDGTPSDMNRFLPIKMTAPKPAKEAAEPSAGAI